MTRPYVQMFVYTHTNVRIYSHANTDTFSEHIFRFLVVGAFIILHYTESRPADYERCSNRACTIDRHSITFAGIDSRNVSYPPRKQSRKQAILDLGESDTVETVIPST